MFFHTIRFCNVGFSFWVILFGSMVFVVELLGVLGLCQGLCNVGFAFLGDLRYLWSTKCFVLSTFCLVFGGAC